MHPPSHDASAIYRYRDCLAAADCLCAAIIHLDLFTLLAREPLTVVEIATRFGIAPRPTDAMVTLCASAGLLGRDAAGRWSATGVAREFLVAGAAFDARSYYTSMAERSGVADWVRVLRTGRPANWPGQEGEADWHAAMRTEAFAEAFTAAMDCRGRVLAPALAAAIDGPGRNLLDIGGGSGVYAIACAEAVPGLEATVFEASPVDAIARRMIERSGCGDRVKVVTGDMFADPWPEGHDTHLFSNVLHDWDEPECRRLVERSVAILPPRGRVVVHDMFVADTKDGPAWAAEYSVLLAGVTQGRLYSVAEVTAWMAALGLQPGPRKATALGREAIAFARP
jgi:predicted O-methyltransferase YrrM